MTAWDWAASAPARSTAGSASAPRRRPMAAADAAAVGGFGPGAGAGRRFGGGRRWWWRRRWWRRRRRRRRRWTGTERRWTRGQAGRGGRGPFNGQYASFGNRRRTTPPVQGSVAITVRNSALNAAPYSLNGQTAQKPYSANNNLNANIGGPLHIPKIVNWQRAQYTITFGTTINRNGRSMLGSRAHGGGARRRFLAGLGRHCRRRSTIRSRSSPFPNNLIPTSRFNSAVGRAAAVLSRTPPTPESCRTTAS